METANLRRPLTELTNDWEPQVRAYFSMMAPEEKADTIARIRRLIMEWEEESGLGMLKVQTN
jgi:hypothetical protein